LNKKSFLIHIDSLAILDDLTDEQAGQLFKAIKAHQDGSEIELSALVKIAFSPFKNQFIRDDEKYKKTCEARALAGSKGGKQKVANASKAKQSKANLADNDNKNKNKKKNGNKNIRSVSPKLDFKSWPNIPSDQILTDWKKLRTRLKANVTQTVINRMGKELTKAECMGYTVDECLEECVFRGWRGFEAGWLKLKTESFKNESGEPF